MAVGGLWDASHRAIGGVTAPDSEFPLEDTSPADAGAIEQSATLGTGSAIALGCTLLSVILLVLAILIILALDRF